MELITPYNFQLAGADWLAERQDVLLADVMGLGKSAQAVRASDLIGAQRILVVCPASVRMNWRREFHRFSPVDRQIVVLMPGMPSVPDPEVLVVSYEQAYNHRKILMARTWDALILDEAHYLKEREARRTKAIYGYANHPGLKHRAKRVWRLTGTPAPNNAGELYTHLRSAGLVSIAYWDFVFQFCTGFNHDYGFKITGHKNVEELKKILAPFMLRRTLMDVDMELPPFRFQEVVVPASKVELDPWFVEQIHNSGGKAEFYHEIKVGEQTLKDALFQVDIDYDFHTDKHLLSVMGGLQSALATYRRFTAMAKLPACLDIIEEELKNDPAHKVVIFAIHRSVIETTMERFRPFKPVTVYGNTPAEKKQKHIDRFIDDPHTRVFIGNIQAAGTGIDGLQKVAHCVEFLEQDWVPSNNAQALARVHRNGQTKRVRARVFLLENSLDERITKALTRKTTELARIF